MQRVQKRHDVTLDSLTRELDEDREGAREAGQYSAAISAVLGKAKLHGLIVDKSKSDITTDGKPIAPILNVTVGRTKP